MGNKLQQIIKFVREPENIINLIGIFIASILAYSGIISNSTSQTLTAILTILTALAISQIVVSYENSKSKKALEAIQETLRNLNSSTNYPPLLVRSELSALQERAKDARDIVIVGRTAVVVLRQTDFFKERLRQGTTVRLAFTDPNNNAVIEALAPLAETSKDGLLADLRSTIGIVNRMKEQSLNSSKFFSQFQVRTFSYVPTLSFVMIDGHLPSGHIVVEMLPFQIAPASRPLVYITAKDYPVWFAYFRNVIDAIWTDGKVATSLFREKKVD